MPFGRAEYYEARPGIAIDKGAVLKLNDELGLHLAMHGFKKLFDEGWLSIPSEPVLGGAFRPVEFV